MFGILETIKDLSVLLILREFPVHRLCDGEALQAAPLQRDPRGDERSQHDQPGPLPHLH